MKILKEDHILCLFADNKTALFYVERKCNAVICS
jgi:hypothetical protein